MPVNKNNGYHTLSKDLSERIEQDRANHWVNPYACPDSAIIRRFDDHDKPHLWRPAFVMDVEKILHNNYYNRYSDKTQVISCYKKRRYLQTCVTCAARLPYRTYNRHDTWLKPGSD